MNRRRKQQKKSEKLGRRAEVLQASVADFQAWGDMVKKALELFGHIDILVNNAGITQGQSGDRYEGRGFRLR